MDMYMDNTGFQVLEGTTPFDEDGQFQEADSLPVAPYPETATETEWYGGMDGAGSLPAEPYQETMMENAWYDNMEGTEELPAAPYQEMTAEYGAEPYMEEVDTLPVEPGQEEMLETDETGQSKEPETAVAETAQAASGEDEEESRRAEHEASEARRKAEWEEKQQVKKAAEQEKLDQLAGMSDDDAVSAAMKRVGADTEKLTRRNMKDCVAEYIQTRCLEDPGFARMVMHPRKSMINCFHYINRKAQEFVEQEMEDNDRKPENGVYGTDVPDDLCYQWAEDYFRDPDVDEDEVKEEKFVPKPYISSSSSKAKQKKTAKKKEPAKTQKAVKEPNAESADTDNYAQISFMDTLMTGSQTVPELKVG